jgi:hypothetical protein
LSEFPSLMFPISPHSFSAFSFIFNQFFILFPI